MQHMFTPQKYLKTVVAGKSKEWPKQNKPCNGNPTYANHPN